MAVYGLWRQSAGVQKTENKIFENVKRLGSDGKYALDRVDYVIERYSNVSFGDA